MELSRVNKRRVRQNSESICIVYFIFPYPGKRIKILHTASERQKFLLTVFLSTSIANELDKH
jgi:hypothetical protein